MNLDTQLEYKLEDDRVLLKPLKRGDLVHLLPYALYEPELWRYSLLPANGEANMEAYIEFALKQHTLGNSYPFIVFDKQREAYAGSTRFYDIQPQHKTLQLGYTWYGKDFQGTGLNKHCKFLLLEFAFEAVGAERVEFRADAKNTRSIAAMKSIGCTEEGILRSNCTAPMGRRDSIVLSILKEEWYSTIRTMLENKLN